MKLELVGKRERFRDLTGKHVRTCLGWRIDCHSGIREDLEPDYRFAEGFESASANMGHSGTSPLPALPHIVAAVRKRIELSYIAGPAYPSACAVPTKPNWNSRCCSP